MVGILWAMLRVLLRMVVFVAVVAGVWILEAMAVVVISGEVSCYEVCSPTTEWFEDAAPWPALVGAVIALTAGWAASRLVRPRR